MTVGAPVATPPAQSLDSLFDMIIGGGPVMIPIALCSVIALAYSVERWVRLTPFKLGGKSFARELIAGLRDGGRERGLALCQGKRTPLARIMGTALERWDKPFLEVEKAVEDAGAREVRHLAVNLRPLIVVAAIAPLLGLLGTVWGMIQAFSTIAMRDGLGKPEMLASGISQALITTAAGLAIAIPTQAAYFYLKARIERFSRQTEDLYLRVGEALQGEAGHAHS
jgi:biopolymer transport protein ExbB